MASDSVERERTWLVRSLPHPLPPGVPVVQGYLVADDGVAVRVHRSCTGHVMTVQGRGSRRGTELDWELTEAQFDAVWPLTRRARVEKVRHAVRLGPLRATIEVFAGPLVGLALVTVEQDDDVDGFTAPDWFGDEVSDDPRYTDATLARDGLPTGHRSPTD
jgi:adenylate cyclase